MPVLVPTVHERQECPLAELPTAVGDDSTSENGEQRQPRFDIIHA